METNGVNVANYVVKDIGCVSIRSGVKYLPRCTIHVGRHGWTVEFPPRQWDTLISQLFEPFLARAFLCCHTFKHAARIKLFRIERR